VISKCINRPLAKSNSNSDIVLPRARSITVEGSEPKFQGGVPKWGDLASIIKKNLSPHAMEQAKQPVN